ncbi:MAG: acyl-CoA dehydratase activase-related protein, partial [Candidatus Atribacteria bacterium]|nr:acyl-CoA dehydratase activase-related protein [Candidatus Atribacteria bacterium]
KDAYFCPKFLGLPDMIKSSIFSLPPLIEPIIDIRKSVTNIKNSFLAVGKLITNNSKKIYQSFYEAQKSLKLYLQSKENEID